MIIINLELIFCLLLCMSVVIIWTRRQRIDKVDGSTKLLCNGKITKSCTKMWCPHTYKVVALSAYMVVTWVYSFMVFDVAREHGFLWLCSKIMLMVSHQILPFFDSPWLVFSSILLLTSRTTTICSIFCARLFSYATLYLYSVICFKRVWYEFWK